MLTTREIVLGLIAAAALGVAGCEKQPGAHEHAPGEDAHEHAPGDGHGGEGGDGHAHDHDASAEHNLGSAMIGASEVSAAHHGGITPGEECDVDIRLGGGAPAPAAVRVWIGVEDGTGSMKARAEDENDHYHAHVEAPDPLPQDARLWVEIEGADGTVATGSFALAG